MRTDISQEVHSILDEWGLIDRTHGNFGGRGGVFYFTLDHIAVSERSESDGHGRRCVLCGPRNLTRATPRGDPGCWPGLITGLDPDATLVSIL